MAKHWGPCEECGEESALSVDGYCQVCIAEAPPREDDTDEPEYAA